MKVLHLSLSDLDGGAARGAYQIHKALQRLGVDSQMLVARKVSTDPSVIGPTEQAKEMIVNSLRPVIDRLPLRRYPYKTTHVFSPAIFPTQILPQVQALDPDVINLQWINKGFVRPEGLQKFKKPVVWTLRDMWSFTGGCHYTEGCDRYTQRCGACPQLGSQNLEDLSRKLWQRKTASFQGLNLHLIAVSEWLASCARRSSLLRDFPVTVVGTTIDTQTFIPRSQATARKLLKLDPERRYILFGALNPTRDRRKGFQHLQPALQQLRDRPNTELLLLGTAHVNPQLDLELPVTCLGKVFDDLTLSLAYNAADVVVVPSVQDACPKSAMEALACGTPVVCFDTTGLKDMVVHEVNGYRARCFDPQDLAEGLNWVLDLRRDRLRGLWEQARHTIETKYDPGDQAWAYLQVYQQAYKASL